MGEQIVKKKFFYSLPPVKKKSEEKIMENLKSYQSAYASLTAEITANLSQIGQNLKLDALPEDSIDTKTLLERIDKSFEDASDLFEQMELEIREIPSAEEKSRQNNHLASFKAELKRLQLEYNSTRRRVQRKTLLNNHSEEDSNYLEVEVINSAKDRLIDNTENLERSTRKLEQGQELLQESESVGASVLVDLAQQREILSRSRNRLRNTDDDLGTGSRILSVMIMRVQRSRIVLALIAILVVIAIIVSVYLSFFG